MLPVDFCGQTRIETKLQTHKNDLMKDSNLKNAWKDKGVTVKKHRLY